MATTVLRPNGTVNAAGTIVGGAGSTHASLDDDDDATYVEIDSSDNIEVDLTSLTLGTDRVVNFRIRARMRDTGGGVAGSTLIGLVDGGFTYGFDAFNPTGSWSEISTPYFGVNLTQNNINSMRLRTDGTNGDIDIAELYVDVVTTSQPVVAVNTITDPFTASTQPPVSWVNTLDADGGPQTYYEIKVFDEATFGAGFPGIDLDADTPYYTSGETLSGSTTANTGPLETGDTYRVAVRTAQTVNGVAFWSDWDTDDFTLTVATADITSVTVTPSNTAGSFAVAVLHDGTSELWEFVEVIASQDAGTTWSNVRGGTVIDTSALGSGGTFNVTDYAQLRATDTLYRARATRYDAGLPITGAWVQSTPAAQWTGNLEFVKVVADPSLNVAVERFTEGPAPTRRLRHRVSDVIGRPDPIVAIGVRKTGRGSVAILTPDQAAADALRAALDAGAVLFDTPAKLGFDDIRHVVVQSYTSEFLARPGAAAYRVFDLSYIAVAAPSDPDAGTL